MKIRFDNDKKRYPSSDGGMKIPYAQAKRALAAWKWYVVVILTASPLLFFLGKIIVSNIFISAPGFVSLKKINLFSPESGVLEKIYIKKGDLIEKGSPLVRFSLKDLDDEISSITSEITELNDKKKNSVVDQQLRKNILLARELRMDRRTHLNQLKLLVSEGAATAAELRFARSQYIQSEEDVSRAVIDYALSVEKHTPGATESTELQLKKKLKNIEKIRSQVDFKTPVSGVLSEMFIVESQHIDAGAKLAEIMVPGDYSIKAYISPSDINHVKKGKKVQLRMPDNTFINGYITSNPEMTATVPPELADTFSQPKKALEVTIMPLSSLSPKYQIDKLPLTVYLGFHIF